MQLPASFVSKIDKRLTDWAALRQPDLIVGTWVNPYLIRHWIFGSKEITPAKALNGATRRSRTLFGARPYFHIFRRSDDDRAHHDHPAWSFSICTGGAAEEHTILAGGIHKIIKLRPGVIRLRSAKFAHRIVLPPGGELRTIFIFGPDIRQWGFHCKNGWISAKEFLGIGSDGCGDSHE